MDKKDRLRNNSLGTTYAFLSYFLWGILPVYWKLIKSVAPWELLANRVFWSFVFLLSILLITRQLKKVKEVFSNKKNMVLIMVSAVMITVNWGVYIWAVNANHVVDVSLGYYINPLLSVVLGVLFFKEKLKLGQKIAVFLATVGVLILTLHYGNIPWIAFILAASFAIYGALKKYVQAEVMISLFIETAMMAPAACLYLSFKIAQGSIAYEYLNTAGILILIGTGVVTIIPMMLFAKGARMIPMTTLGFTQYISPTMSLLLGVFVFGEPFTNMHLISFSLIWVALLVFASSQANLIQTLKSSGILINIKNIL